MKRFIFLVFSPIFLYSLNAYAALGDETQPAESCNHIITVNSGASSGIYRLQNGSMTSPKQYYCEMDYAGGGRQLLFQRRGGEKFLNREECGKNVNEFLHGNKCGEITSIGQKTGFDISYTPGDIADIYNNFSPSEYLTLQYDSKKDREVDANDANIIHTKSNLFPNTRGGVKIPFEKVCNINNKECDDTDGFWIYAGTARWHYGLCNRVFAGPSNTSGVYGYCADGRVSAGFGAKFGERGQHTSPWWRAYEEAKYRLGLSRPVSVKVSSKYAERVFIKTPLPEFNVVINEVEYDPIQIGKDADHERIELYNAGTGDILLDGWTIVDNQTSNENMLNNINILAEGYVVLVNDETSFRSNYPSYTGTVIELDDAIELSNSGDHLTLSDHYGREIDHVEREGDVASGWNVKTKDKPICRIPNGNDATGTGADRSELCYATPGAPNDIDNVPPTITKHTVTLPGGDINQPTIIFSGTDDKSGIRFWTIIIDEGGTDERTITLSGGATSYKPNPDLTGDRHTIKYRATDRAGNFSENTITYPPIVEIISPTTISGSTITDNTITITGPAAMEIVSLTASGANDPSITCTPPLSRTMPRTIGPTGFTCTVGDITTGGLITYTAVSSLGFTGSTQQTYIIDGRLPVITFPEYVDANAIYSGTISIEVEDDTTVSSQYGRVAKTGDCVTGVSLTGDTFGTGMTFDLEIEAHNGQYLCVRAEDQAGNISYQTSTHPPLIDRTPPVITLQGGSTMTLEKGVSFTDPGASCTDAITACILKSSGTVDTSTPGVYTITYTAEDDVGNISQTTRTVTVTERMVVTGGSGGWDTSDDATHDDNDHSNPSHDPNTGDDPLGGLRNPDFVTQCFDPLHETTIYQNNHVTQDFRDAHQLIYSYGLTRWRGTADYGPRRLILREEAARFFTEFATNILCRIPSYTYHHNFTDIDDADPTLHDFIRKSFEYGIFHGDDGDAAAGVVTTFRPKDTISRDELAAIVVRLVTNQYNESNNKHWADHYHRFVDRYSSTSLETTSRDNTARLIYDLYRNNTYNLQSVGYVIDAHTKM